MWQTRVHPLITWKSTNALLLHQQKRQVSRLVSFITYSSRFSSSAHQFHQIFSFDYRFTVHFLVLGFRPSSIDWRKYSLFSNLSEALLRHRLLYVLVVCRLTTRPKSTNQCYVATSVTRLDKQIPRKVLSTHPSLPYTILNTGFRVPVKYWPFVVKNRE